jgi:PIN domain nuclease of toxin-antitoxin system
VSKKYLIDTHILIWYLDGNPILPVKIKKELDDATNKVYVSVASLWEFTIKLAKQKLDIEINIQQVEAYITDRDYEF